MSTENKLEALLAQLAAPRTAPPTAAKEACLRELAKGPSRRPWRTEALWLALAPLAAGALVGAGAFLAGAAEAAWVQGRALPLAVLALAGALGGALAVAPHRRGLRALAVALLLGAQVLLVLTRLDVHGVSAVPGWVCTANHVAVGLLPLGVALWLLRRAAHSPLRALTAGLSAGTAGALVGELACGQGAAHVAVFHLGAWAAVTALCVLLSRRQRRYSFAP